MTTANDMTPVIGQTVQLRVEDIKVLVMVLNAKNSYGRLRLLVTPVAGSGEQWVEMSRVSLIDNQQQ